MKVNLYLDADFLNDLKLFRGKRVVSMQDVHVQRLNNNMVRFYATDGRCLLGIERFLSADEVLSIEKFSIPVNFIPKDPHVLKYQIKIDDDEKQIVISDMLNTYTLARPEYNGFDTNNLFEELKNAPQVDNKFFMFSPNSVKIAEKVLKPDCFYKYPKCNNSICMWQKKVNEVNYYVILMAIKLGE